MNLTDKHYIDMMSSSLEKFTWVGDKANFRCPFCNDSAKNKNKKRAWFLTHNRDSNVTIFKCHNCDKNTNLFGFIKEFYPHLVSQYLMDTLTTNVVTSPIEVKHSRKIEKEDMDDACEYLLRVTKEIRGTSGELYLNKRKAMGQELFRFVPDVNELYEDEKFRKLVNLEQKVFYKQKLPAIYIPLKTIEGKLYAFQFRFLEGQMRYRTFKLDKTIDYKVWGLDRVDTSKTVYITEGVFDSICLPNSIAMCGSSINFEILNDFKNKCIFILDNERENIQIIKKMENILDKGFKLFIWNKSKSKDINDYFIDNGNVDIFLNKKPVEGLMGKLILSNWIKERNV